MTYYHQELLRIKNHCYGNERQLRAVIKTRHFIDHNYDQAINLDLLSGTNHTSKYHLLRLFKRYYGQTPLQYLTGKRLIRARYLLKQGRTVTETCFEVGFESLASFSLLFRNRFGVNPAKFKKEQFSISMGSGVC